LNVIHELYQHVICRKSNYKINYLGFLFNSRHLHQIPNKTWQNMPSFKTKRLDSKGIGPFFLPEHN
ncbi:hypothetical protein, partial [Acinetobacter baumannii]|uniref:hypothetical protein n=5 Tax=Acinetobacter baumannii TaxID=470 RepID=UPI003AFA3A58